MKKAEVEEFFARLRASNPEPKGELSYKNPFTLLVAVVLSAQATDTGVNKATVKLFQVADTPEAMLALGEAGLKEHIKSIGLYNSKAKNVLALSRKLIEEHGGEVPRERAALETLPGVGRKTANVVLNVAFGGGHPRLPRGQPHRPRARADSADGRAEARAGGPSGLQAARPSLAHSARAVYLQGAQA